MYSHQAGFFLQAEFIYQEYSMLLWSLGGPVSVSYSLKDPTSPEVKIMNKPYSPEPEPHRISKEIRPPSNMFREQQHKRFPRLGRNCSLGPWENGSEESLESSCPCVCFVSCVPSASSIFLSMDQIQTLPSVSKCPIHSKEQLWCLSCDIYQLT